MTPRKRPTRTRSYGPRDRTRSEYLRRKYGITNGEYERILDSQGGVCAICKRTGRKRLAVDHDHRSGMVRGLLCWRCNKHLISNFRDPERFYSAAEYLRSSDRRIVDALSGGKPRIALARDGAKE